MCPIRGHLADVEKLASGAAMRELPRLHRLYGAGGGRKRKRARPQWSVQAEVLASPNFTGKCDERVASGVPAWDLARPT